MKYPLLAIPLSTLLILTGCGGSGSGGDDAPNVVAPPPPPPPAVAPTVTVTAPASAIAGIAFNVAWTSTDATSCASAFTAVTTASGTAAVTEAAVGEKSYAVTCTGAGGSTTSEPAIVNVGPQATAEGLWQGTGAGNGGNRTVSGVITKENQYWLAYSSTTGVNLTGFVAGLGSSVIDATGTAGTFPSIDLREFNFEGGGAGGGNLSLSTYNKTSADKTTHTFNAITTSTALSASYTFSGEQDYAIDNVTTNCDDGINPSTCAILTETPNPPTFDGGASPWTIVPSANDPSTGSPKLIGSFRFQPYQIVADLNPSLIPVILTMNFPDRELSFDSSAATSVTWNPTTRELALTGVTFNEVSPSYTCDDQLSGLCSLVPTPSIATKGDVTITYTDANLDHYIGVAHTYQLANAAVGNGCIGLGGGDWCANGLLTFEGTIPSAPSVSQTVATTYNAAYETAPTLAAIEGSYSGSAGVAAAIQAGATFVVAADGGVTGTETTGCTYAGTAATHAGGNVYDVTLTFTAGGSCTYAGPFTGVATYDAVNGSITVTAINTHRDQGFLFTGTKVP